MCILYVNKLKCTALVTWPEGFLFHCLLKSRVMHLCYESRNTKQTRQCEHVCIPVLQGELGTMERSDHGGRPSKLTCEKHHKADWFIHSDGPFACQQGMMGGGVWLETQQPYVHTVLPVPYGNIYVFFVVQGSKWGRSIWMDFMTQFR